MIYAYANGEDREVSYETHPLHDQQIEVTRFPKMGVGSLTTKTPIA